MQKLPCLVFLLFIMKGIHGEDPFEGFLGDLIDEWNLQSPTIVVQDDLPGLCSTSQWVVCVFSDMDTTELAEHIAKIARGSKQDSLIFGPGQGHVQLLDNIEQVEPSMFRSNTLVIMPLEYSGMIELRLDSNVVFYEEEKRGAYNLLDKFAVKGGPPIAIDLGKWDASYGMRLHNYKNRWDRRTDLRGAEMVNSLNTLGPWSILLKDVDGNVIGSVGQLQDMIFYITERVNLTIKTVELNLFESWEMSENGSWGGGVGVLQRKEADVCSFGMGVLLDRALVIDFPFPVINDPTTLFALKPTGIAPNMWVYVRVFGVIQWAIYLLLLMVFATVMTMILMWRREKWQDSQMKYVPTALGTSFLFTIQMGEHPDTKYLGTRILTLTTAMLTLLLWVYYNNDITAEMTSGPPENTVSTFEDVIHYDYRVVSHLRSLVDQLRDSDQGTAKHETFNRYFYNGEEEKDVVECILEMISDEESKTLLFAQKISVIPKSNYEKFLMDKIYPLKMDDSSYNLLGLGLQKDSEFLGIFNHYLLKQMENGINMKARRSLQNSFYVNEHFEMPEPQPLGSNNVMFLFILLGLGIMASVIVSIGELAVRKHRKYSRPSCLESDKEVILEAVNKVNKLEAHDTSERRTSLTSRSLHGWIMNLIRKRLY